MTRILQPKSHEPIRLIETTTGPRYRVVLDTAPKGAARKQVTKTFDTIAEARRFVADTRQMIARGNYTAPSKVTFAQLANDWLSSRRNIREVSVEGYRSVLGPVVDRLGDRTAQSITRPEIDALVESLERDGGRRHHGLSQRTLVYTLGAVRQVFDYGISSGVLPSNPARDVQVRRKRKGDRKAVAVWQPDELARFRAQADLDEEPWVRAAFRLTLSGLRRSEVLGLSWDCVDLDAGTVSVEASRVKVGRGRRTTRDDPKSDASERLVRVEAIHPGTLAALRALKAQQAGDRLAAGGSFRDTGLVVVDALGDGIHPDAYSNKFRTLSSVAGVTRIRLHAVRHTLALILHRAGVAPADAAALLGHTVATHLQFYVPGTKEGANSAAVRLGESISSSTERA